MADGIKDPFTKGELRKLKTWATAANKLYAPPEAHIILRLINHIERKTK